MRSATGPIFARDWGEKRAAHLIHVPPSPAAAKTKGLFLDKPMCRVCDEKHWSSEPHKFGRKPNSVDQAVDQAPSKPNTRPVVAVTCGRCAELEREVADLRTKLEGRRSYQRDYMRKRRAK